MRIVFVHVVDQIQFDVETAQLVQVAVEEGAEAHVVLADYGTADAAFVENFTEPTDAVLFHVTWQTLPVIRHMATTLELRYPELPFIFYGPLMAANAEMAAENGVKEATLLCMESEQAFRSLLRDGLKSLPAGSFQWREGQLIEGAPVEPVPADAVPNPNFGAFGGASLFKRGIGCSFFGETGVFPLETRIGSDRGPCANAALEPFNRWVPGAPRARSEALLIDRLTHMHQDFPGVHTVEIRDGDFGDDRPHAEMVLDLFSQHFPALRVDVRMRPETLDPAFAQKIADSRGRRLVFECDRAPGAVVSDFDPGTDPEALRTAFAHARSAGLEVGVLLSIGRLGESAGDIQAKIDFLRELECDRLRVLPFEPRYGHPVWDVANKGGHLPVGPDSWNREVYEPLKQVGLDREEWIVLWQKALDLQAERECAPAFVAKKKATTDRTLLPVEIRKIPRGSVLVIAPHPDDEMIGPGGTLLRHVKQGDAVSVVVVFDGVHGDPEQRFDPEQYVATRQEESRQVAREYFKTEDVHFHAFTDGLVEGDLDKVFPNLPDDPDEKVKVLLAGLASHFRAHIERTQPKTIYYPWRGESHSDHWVCAAAFEALLQNEPDLFAGRNVLAYEVWSTMLPDYVVDIRETVDDKCEAIGLYKSQTDYVDYGPVMKGLNLHRGMGLNEAFRDRLPTPAEAFRGHLEDGTS